MDLHRADGTNMVHCTSWLFLGSTPVLMEVHARNVPTFANETPIDAANLQIITAWMKSQVLVLKIKCIGGNCAHSTMLP